MRSLLTSALVAAIPCYAVAQVPARPDSVRDSLAPTRLPDVNVAATRGEVPLQRSPFAVGVLDRTELQRGQPTLGLDEALNNMPGVVVANRYNFSLDQRISIRGFGARASFGIRGVKVLVDGVPQTLPDGQSQLTNVEFANIDRVEVLRGSSSSLHGNAAGGVLSMTSEPAAAAPFAQQLRVEGGGGDGAHDGFYKWQSWSSARRGPVSGTLSISQFKTDGFRQHSAAELRQLNGAIDYLLSASTAATVRFSAADNPRAQNPGALTRTEYANTPDAAAPNNINRGADKDVQQQQLSFGLRHFDDRGNEYAITAFGLHRTLANPIAAPPDGGVPGPNAGTYISIGRWAGGARLTGSQQLGSTATHPRLTFGADVQRLRDDRFERQSLSGAPTSTVLVDQLETITEIGPFLQALWTPTDRLLVSAGTRYDWVRFNVDDHFTGDGADNSGGRTMHAPSGNVGASWRFNDAFIPYANVSTSFETPTTTELKNQPEGSGGFNDQLDPQRAVNYEIGMRGQASRRLNYSVALFLNRITDAIVQDEDIGGRAFFRNAGRVHNDGVEVGVTASPTRCVTLRGAYTYAHYRFRSENTSINGNRLPGVPEHFWRLGLRTSLPHDSYLDVDHTLSSSIATDDANTPALYADSWGAGVTNARVGLSGQLGELQVGPFLGVNNLWDRRYIGAVTTNGAGGRVFEPAPGRVIYVGAEIGYRAAR